MGRCSKRNREKEEQSVEYDHTDELWLNIYIPWVESIVSYEMDIGKSDIATIRKRLLQSKFQRIYLSSIREHDTFVLKTNNGKICWMKNIAFQQ